MIGLVLGDTQLGNLIIKKLILLKKQHIIIDISKEQRKRLTNCNVSLSSDIKLSKRVNDKTTNNSKNPGCKNDSIHCPVSGKSKARREVE